MIGHLQQSRSRDRLEQEAKSQGLEYLAYLFVPLRGGEGLMLEAGSPTDGHRSVATLNNARGRSELQWNGEGYSREQAHLLIEELAPTGPPALSERLHSTVCQSLTAAHLQLELGLMSEPEAKDDFEMARRLVQEATTSVRELIDELAGGGQ